MKTKKIVTSVVLCAFLIIGIVSFMSATSFSPSSLIYNLQPGEEKCLTVTFGSESETIAVSDSWAANKDVEWKVSNFDTTADSHGIWIDYPSEVMGDEGSLEVCLSGDDVGEYHGVLLLREEQEGNSIVQMGIWLKVIISEEDLPPMPSAPTSEGGSGSSGGGGGGSGVSAAVVNTTNEESETILDGEDEDGNGSAPITGGAVGVRDLNLKGLLVTLVVAALAVVGMVYFRRKGNE